MGSLKLHVATDHSASYMALNTNEGFIMTLEGNIAEDVYSHCRIPHIYENPVPQEKDDSRTY